MLISPLLSGCITTVLVISALGLIVLSGFLLLEALTALLPPPRRTTQVSQRDGRVAVLIPAHNEEICIGTTLKDLLPQLQSSDRLVVIADNCTDATATIARQLGATVIERENLIEIGKGYALDYGIKSLASDPPDIVIFIDADCRIAPGTIAQLAQLATLKNRPVQATYLMEKPPAPSPKDAVSTFAFTVKNLVRPLGLARLNLPCLLTGTGMAFPWTAIRSVSLASGHLVEDMKLSLDLTIAGYAPIYCPEANIMGCLPQQERAAQTQRTRWEHGHLQAMMAYVPLLLQAAVQQRKPAAIALALELSVPPLSLLVMIWVAGMGITAAWGVVTAVWLPAGLAAIAGSFLAIAILSAWVKFGYKDLPLGQLLSIPFYILWKIPLYFKFLVKPQTTWVRTERDGVEPKAPVTGLLDK